LNTLEQIYSSISPELRNVLLRLTGEEILNLKHSTLRSIPKSDILQVFNTLNYSDYINNDFYAIVADPPWPYNNTKTGGSMISAAAQKYRTMKIKDLKRLGVLIKDLTIKHPSILFLWVTTNFQEEAMELVKEWGYIYKTKMYWIKPRAGMGSWFRNRAEELWICVSKNYESNIRAFHFQFTNVIEAPAVGHSTKPFIRKIVSDALDRAISDSNNKKKLELFARKEQFEDMRVLANTEDNKTWVLHGDGIDREDIGEALISKYYDMIIRNFARMKYYEGWIADVYDLANLQEVLQDPKNKTRRKIMVRVDSALKKNSINNVLEVSNSL
jgi:N6-adenosine-specific RNA methylase IME4